MKKNTYKLPFNQWWWDKVVMGFRKEFDVRQPINDFHDIAAQRGVMRMPDWSSENFIGFQLGEPYYIGKSGAGSPHLWFPWNPDSQKPTKSATCWSGLNQSPTPNNPENLAAFSVDQYTAIDSPGNPKLFGPGLYRFKFDSHTYNFGWNAIWLYGKSSDGSIDLEIDVMEHYGRLKEGHPTAESNFHMGKYNKGPHGTVGTVDMRTFDFWGGELVLDWHKDSIRIFLDGSLVRKIVDRKVLDEFAKAKLQLKFTSSCIDRASLEFDENKIISTKDIHKVTYHSYGD